MVKNIFLVAHYHWRIIREVDKVRVTTNNDDGSGIASVALV